MEGKQTKYVKLGDLLVYRKSIELGDIAWAIYDKMEWTDKKIMGDQFIRSIDSFGANIVEGYGRYHYLDRIKFYYIARASLNESKHWMFLLHRRNKVDKEIYDKFLSKAEQGNYQLNQFISITYNSKNTKQNNE